MSAYMDDVPLPAFFAKPSTCGGAGVRSGDVRDGDRDRSGSREPRCRWLLASLFGILALANGREGRAEGCQIKANTEARCLSPGSACTEGGLKGRCQQLADECECLVRAPPPAVYRIGGAVIGLSGANSVVIQDNAITELSAANGPFYFTTNIPAYSISVVQPSGQQCTVSNSSGTATAKGVSNIVVTCTTPADVTACDSRGCVSERQICANVGDSLANPPSIAGVSPPAVVGYVCIAGALPAVYGGLARTAADPPQTAMSPDLTTNIASVSKTMTAIGILQLLAKNGLSIDTPISSYLYKDWIQGPNIGQLTFKELLNHTSGLGQLTSCGNALGYSDLQTLVATGIVTPANIGVAQYGNCNFTLLRELMPALLGQSPACFPGLFGLGTVCFPYGAQRAEMSSALYISYMNAHVFEPAGVPVSACKPPAGTGDMLSYPDPAGTSSGTDFGDWSLTCGAGGWSLSASQIFSVVNSLAGNNRLLTNDQKNQMFTNCLGWDCAVRTDCPGPYVCKNGDLPGPRNTVPWSASNISVWTYAGILNCAIPVVVVVNSNTPPPYQAYATTPESPDLIDLVANAYAQAAVPGNTQTCPYPDP